MEKLLDYAEKEHKNPFQLPYVISTAWWESAQTMHPVKEAYWKSEEWRKRNLRYYPWYGRGLIQTTWEKNYERIWKLLGRTAPIDPDAFLTWEVAIPALFIGMEKGLYTGKDLDDFIDNVDESDDQDLREYINARRIVNGTDKALNIGKNTLIFERALKKGKYGKET
jgi:putative chitinase